MSEILDETIQAIKESNHKITDISFIGSADGYACTWEQFRKLAEQDDNNYYSGLGGQTLATDLVIVFADGEYLERGEYDGSEWWEHRKPFVIPTELKPIRHIANGDSWASLKEMNQNGGKYGNGELQ